MNKEFMNTSLAKGEEEVFCHGTTRESEYSLREMLKLNQCPQRTDPLERQLNDVILAAEKLGCFYASHFIKNILKK